MYPSIAIAKKTTKFVNEIGTLVNGRVIESGPSMHIRAVIKLTNTNCFVFNFISQSPFIIYYIISSINTIHSIFTIVNL